jgi:hypothetical protein
LTDLSKDALAAHCPSGEKQTWFTYRQTISNYISLLSLNKIFGMHLNKFVN